MTEKLHQLAEVVQDGSTAGDICMRARGVAGYETALDYLTEVAVLEGFETRSTR